ncbi:hypothetical protein HOF65_08050 [bacterium]|jgi:hypothetical protein|nr:hypothetical protein [bacterium]MBT4632853.1 hypothetical protein [bacterium]MBT5491576.1 hypothetical protein [bacterium]MBT6779232.1 hypothetical protein [bacterium]
MTKLKIKLSDIKDSNLVFLVEKNSDLKQLQSLKLDKSIILKIEKVIKDSKNQKLDFFL